MSLMFSQNELEAHRQSPRASATFDGSGLVGGLRIRKAGEDSVASYGGQAERLAHLRRYPSKSSADGEIAPKLRTKAQLSKIRRATADRNRKRKARLEKNLAS